MDFKARLNFSIKEYHVLHCNCSLNHAITHNKHRAINETVNMEIDYIFIFCD